LRSPAKAPPTRYAIPDRDRSHLRTPAPSAISAKVTGPDAAGDDRVKMGHVVVASDHMPESVERCVDQIAAGRSPLKARRHPFAGFDPFAGAIEPFVAAASATISSAT
jgi:hypothetical protein